MFNQELEFCFGMFLGSQNSGFIGKSSRYTVCACQQVRREYDGMGQITRPCGTPVRLYGEKRLIGEQRYCSPINE